MKITILQENLTKGLSIVSRAVAGRSTTLPVLSNILVATDGDQLKLSATNLEIGVNCWVGAKVEQEGAITVPAKTFTDLVSTFPPDRIDMELSVRTQTLHLRCGRSEANIKGIDAQEFPLIPSPEGDEQILIEPDVLKKMINQVAFAATTDESRLMLTGVLTKFDGDQLTMSAADGFRVAIRDAAISTPIASVSVLIPSKALTYLERLLGDQTEPVEVSFTPSRNQIVFSLSNTDLVAQLIDLQFPDVDQIIPKSYTTRTVVNTKDLLKALRAANIFAREAANTVKLTIEKGGDISQSHIQVTARSDETGDNAGRVDATVDGFGLVIAFNVRYMLDVLSSIDTPQVALELTASGNPGVIRPVGDSDYIHVIMPMQIIR